MADAQSNLGVLIANGLGVSQDYAEAANWFRKAAEHGLPNGQFNLGTLYYSGKGVLKDLIQAHLALLMLGSCSMAVKRALSGASVRQRKNRMPIGICES